MSDLTTLQPCFHNVSRKMLLRMFHRHIPNYTSQTVSNLDPRQHNHPNNAETQNNVGGDVAWRAKLPAMTQFHWLSRTNVWNVSFILLILVITKMEEASLLGADGDGQRGFRIIIRTWFQSPTALVYYPLVSVHTTSYKGWSRTMQMPLVSKFLCYLEAASSKEGIGGNSRPHHSFLQRFCRAGAGGGSR